MASKTRHRAEGQRDDAVSGTATILTATLGVPSGPGTNWPPAAPG
jgi:hypothetical protein